MTNFEKHYIGKGTKLENLDIIRVVLPAEGLDAAMFEKNGIKYLSFEVAKLKEADKFGRTHTCYFQTKVYTDNPAHDEPVKQKKADKKSSKKQAQPAEDDLPY